jgi:glycine cleavage system aminomethyltransferase T
VTLTVDDPADGEPFGEAVYLSTVLVNGASAGLVVSAGYGHRVGASIAMAVIDEDALVEGAIWQLMCLAGYAMRILLKAMFCMTQQMQS